MSILGIDIGPLRLESGRIGASGEVLSSRVVRTPSTAEALETALVYIVASGEPPAAVGISCGHPQCPEERPVEDLLRRALGADIPIAAAQTARAILAGEVAWGAARRCSDVLLLRLEQRVTGAVLAGGKILEGCNGAAGSLGHITVEPGGAPCACGSRGCLETVISSSAIEAEARSAVERACPSLLTGWFRSRRQGITCHAVFEAAAGGDPLACALAGRAVRGLGTAIANLVNIFDSQLVILGGPMAAAASALYGTLRADVARRLGASGRTPPIVPQAITAHDGIVGAAALVCARAHNR